MGVKGWGSNAPVPLGPPDVNMESTTSVRYVGLTSIFVHSGAENCTGEGGSICSPTGAFQEFVVVARLNKPFPVWARSFHFPLRLCFPYSSGSVRTWLQMYSTGV